MTPSDNKPIVEAIERLNVDVIQAFRRHDQDLRAEVEKVNARVIWLLVGIGLLAASVLIWPRTRN